MFVQRNVKGEPVFLWPLCKSMGVAAILKVMHRGWVFVSLDLVRPFNNLCVQIIVGTCLIKVQLRNTGQPEWNCLVGLATYKSRGTITRPLYVTPIWLPQLILLLNFLAFVLTWGYFYHLEQMKQELASHPLVLLTYPHCHIWNSQQHSYLNTM